MKFLASDLDGTLFRDNSVAEKDLEALRTLKKLGNKIIVSTGRSLKGVKDILREYPFEYDYLVMCNGALIINKNDEVIQEKVIPNKIQNKIITDFYTWEDSLIYYDDGNGTYVIENDSVDTSKVNADFFNHFSDRVTLEKALNNTLDSQIMSIFNVSQSVEKSELLRGNLLEKYKDHVEAFRNQFFVDIVPRNCSKGNAIMTVLEIEKETTDCLYTVGDSLNDISMFEITNNSYTFNGVENVVKLYANNAVDYVYEVIEDMIK
ncbi:HAD-IIB family hydrolase [Clostridium sp.]|uniref:HAD-IIB family hydrolase n=1 Tax=Clostridium sp. TaxID=1506 RepID=UPI0026039705|nr:HAD-IIB family hydrolase [Clostridium sp.]